MGSLLPLYALPCLGLKATILNHKFFRTFRQNCQEHYLQAMDDLLQGRLLETNIELFEKERM